MNSHAPVVSGVKILFLLLLIGLILGPFGGIHFPTVRKVEGVSRTITLVGYVTPGWNYTSGGPAINVNQGDSITMVLSSGDSHPHRFYVDVNGNNAPDCPGVDKCSGTFSPSTPINFQFTVDFPPGPYTYYCSIHQGSMHGSFNVQAPATPDFSISVTPATFNVAVGASGNLNVQVQSINSFSGTVDLSASVSPAGRYTSVSANPASITLSPGSTSTSVVTFGTSGSSGLYSTPTPDGTYILTVTGTSGALSHSKTATANVGATQNPTGNTPPVDQTPLLVGVGAVVIVAAIATSVLVARNRSRK